MQKHGDKLREQVKLCKVYNSDWSYKQIAEVIEITPHAFYNWLNGYYELSQRKERRLRELLSDLMM
ncbi:MAG: hypothetical protein IKW39_04420 [Alphaproteobacteria bacterium]|nr:hypothetical protein [Alphaproteobacteria bacterium]